MKKIVVVCAGFALALAAGMSHATKPGNNGGGNGGCGVGQTTNGCGGSPGSNTATGGAGGNGYGGTGVGIGVGVGIGQGGAGGAGGQGGQGGRGGEGGSVWGSGNSSNVNANTQGQQQGQAQSSRNSNRNDNRSSATGGNGYASNANSNENHGNNSNQSVTVQGDSYDAPRIPVATAYAPNIAPTAVCMGSTSAGGQGMTFGISFGTSWTDDNCMLLEQVRTVATVIGDKEIAAEMMCDVKAYAAARARAGKPCGQAQVAAAPAPVQSAPFAVEQHQPKYVASAPIVVSPVAPRIERFRVTVDGLQPL